MESGDPAIGDAGSCLIELEMAELRSELENAQHKEREASDESAQQSRCCGGHLVEGESTGW